MSNFFDKYYPGIGKSFALSDIKQLEELLIKRKEEYKKKYGDMPK